MFLDQVIETAKLRDKVTLNLKFSFLLILSRTTNVVVFYESVQYLKQLTGRVNTTDLPSMVEKALTCERAMDSFRNVCGVSNFSVEYKIPPIIIVIPEMSDRRLEGFACLNGCVAIVTTLLNPINKSNCRMMNLINMLGNVSTHGMIRLIHNNSKLNTSDLKDQSGVKQTISHSGHIWEKEFWFGIRPRWFNPINELRAEQLADEIVRQLQNTGNIVFTQQQQQCFINDVGCLEDYQGLPGGVRRPLARRVM